MASYKVVTPPATAVVSTSDAKAHLRVSGTADDAWIDAAIAAATDLLQRYTKRSFVTQTIDLIADEWPGQSERVEWSRSGGGEIVLRRGPVQSVSGVYYTQRGAVEALFDAANYVVDVTSDPGRIALKIGQVWPPALESINGVRVRYVAGYGAAAVVPAAIVHAVKLQVAEWYENRGDTAATGRAGIVPALGQAAKLAIAGYIVPRI